MQEIIELEDYKDFIIGFTVDEIKRCVNVRRLEGDFDIELYNVISNKVKAENPCSLILVRATNVIIKNNIIKCSSEETYIDISEKVYEINNIELKNIISLYKENKLIKNNLSTYIINTITSYDIIKLISSNI